MLKIETLEVTPFAQNCRILADSKSGEAVVVDPGGDIALILSTLKSMQVKLTEIWLTHSHLDHCGGVAELKSKTGALLVAHRIEREMREKVEQIATLYGLPPGLMQNCPEPERYIDEGQSLTIGSHNFEIFFTPGHSPGHLVFYNRENELLIAGDTLFAGSIGRTDLPGGDYETLIRSIKSKIFSLPDVTKVLSGHGPDTSVGEERKNNPFLQAEDNHTG